MVTGTCMKAKNQEYDWDEVLSAASRLQGLVREAVLVGGTASALFAGHRTSYDADHVIPDLRRDFDEVLASLESVAGWQTARVKRPVLILGNLDGIETGIRQLIRSEPLETTEMFARGEKIVVPTEAEILRIKGALILKRNATRDYLDFAALSKHLGNEASVKALERFDTLYPQSNGESALQQLYMQLANPHPFDFREVNLSTYKNLSEHWQNWNNVTLQCQQTASNIINTSCVAMKEVLNNQMYESKRSLGFTWSLPDGGLHVLKAEDAKDALFTFHKYRVEHVSTTLRTLEHIPCTAAQTRSILDGKSTAGLSTRQLRAIENYGNACEKLADLIENSVFLLDKTTICNLHAIVGKDEAKNFGQFRGNQVFIEQSHYIPPKSIYLEGIFSEGMAFLNSLNNAQEKAICSFLFLARSQFFSDCNKRTANLVMNGILMQGGFQPISIDSENFLEKMAKFYETANASEVIEEINDIAKRQYHNDDQSIIPQAEEIKKVQQHLADSVTTYDDTLKKFMQAKSTQADRLETALTEQVNTQRALLNTTKTQRPGRIASLWGGQKWQKQQQTQKARLKVLESRLLRVQALRLDSKKIEIFAEKKLRREQQELTAHRDAVLIEKRENLAQEQARCLSQSHGKAPVKLGR